MLKHISEIIPEVMKTLGLTNANRPTPVFPEEDEHIVAHEACFNEEVFSLDESEYFDEKNVFDSSHPNGT